MFRSPWFCRPIVLLRTLLITRLTILQNHNWLPRPKNPLLAPRLTTTLTASLFLISSNIAFRDRICNAFRAIIFKPRYIPVSLLNLLHFATHFAFLFFNFIPDFLSACTTPHYGHWWKGLVVSVAKLLQTCYENTFFYKLTCSNVLSATRLSLFESSILENPDVLKKKKINHNCE